MLLIFCRDAATDGTSDGRPNGWANGTNDGADGPDDAATIDGRPAQNVAQKVRSRSGQIEVDLKAAFGWIVNSSQITYLTTRLPWIPDVSSVR